MLLLLMLVITMVLITLSASLPGIVGQMRHDREDEMIHRGVQYARAVRLFYKKTNTYPVSIDQLKETNHKRYLRRVYKDPMTGGDFRPLRGSDVTQGGARPTSGDATGAGTPTTFGISPDPNNPAASSGSGANPNAAGSSSTDQTGAMGTPAAPNSPATSNASTITGGSVTSTSLFGALSGGTTANTGTAATAGNTAAGVLGAATAATGQVFGGGAIVGVASLSPKKAFHIYNNKDHYKDWMFIYDPFAEGKGLIKGPYNGPQKTGTGTIPGATPAGQLSSPSSAPTSPTSTGFGSSTFGQSSTGSTGSTPSTP